MPVIKIQYQKVLYEDPKTELFEFLYRPYVDILLKYHNRMSHYPIKCIIDSGADRNLFPAEVDFSYHHQIPLLGRYGFFKYFKKLIFDEDNKIVELEYH